MDLNYIYHRRGVSLFLSRNAVGERARLAHLGMANAYAALIGAQAGAREAAAAADRQRAAQPLHLPQTKEASPCAN